MGLVRQDDRIIIHFDYDCFYASVFEAENPALKNIPLGVVQKNIIVTCNYAARAKGLYKLQLVSAAKQLCPDAVYVCGEDLTRFRDASKMLYKFLEDRIWSKRLERLGLDEVFLDITDMVDYNMEILNRHDMAHSFFCTSRTDPTCGFDFDATKLCGNAADSPLRANDMDPLYTRLLLGSHLAQHLRHALEKEYNYTSSVGISTNKLLSKLVGTRNKPRGQTTLLPPYTSLWVHEISNVTRFLDSYEIGKIPGIGSKLGRKIRRHILGQPVESEQDSVTEGTKETVSVHDVRMYPGMGPDMLERILGGPGTIRGIGAKVWALINGIDDSSVCLAKRIPRQISIEDSYSRLDTIEQVRKELLRLSKSLLKRMRIDLMEDDEEAKEDATNGTGPPGSTSGPDEKKRKRWMAYPKTLRVSTRPKPLGKHDGVKTHHSTRISRTAPLPTFAFSMVENVDLLAERLVKETLIPLFRRLHSDKFILNLINVAVTNMVETAGCAGTERDIGKMFHRQEDTLRAWKVVEEPPKQVQDQGLRQDIPEVEGQFSERAESWGLQASEEEVIPPEESSLAEIGQLRATERDNSNGKCEQCGTVMPEFAIQAHIRFHLLDD